MKIESAVLRRLGPVPFWRGTEKCLDGLQRIYTRAAEAAAAALAGRPARAEPRGGRANVKITGGTR
ncbi:MAG: hypothetical protein J6T01_01375 [Kiritimatiellae bacterium]|nr:hypothetical protein [Kiritimatiellia bacterium]